MTYIYALAEPDTGELRYVGRSSNPKGRVSSHESRSAARGVRKWVAALKNRGLRPALVVLCTVLDASNGPAIEAEVIVQYSAGRRLLNCIGVPPWWLTERMQKEAAA